jgi:DNA-binding CsgD family transcriptional regulator
MTDPRAEFYQGYVELLNSQQLVEEDLDYTILKKYIDIFENLDRIGSSAISIFDFYKRDHSFVSGKYATIFGWDMDRVRKEGIEYTNTLIHPDDLILLLQSGNYFLKMAFELPLNERKDYKLWSEYRMKNPDGVYVRVIEQQMFLEADKKGNIWLALGLLDLSPNQSETEIFQCRAINTKTNNLYLFPPEELNNSSNLSRREIEILKLISKGLISKQIADMLYISVNTVNTHRQRIIEKLGVNNTAEALNLMNSLKLI